MSRNVMYFLSIKKKANCIIQNLLIPEFIFAVYLEMVQKHFPPFSPLRGAFFTVSMTNKY